MFAFVPDVLVEDVVGKQAQHTLVIAEAPADRRHRLELVSVHSRCGIARTIVVRQLHEHLERSEMQVGAYAHAVEQRRGVVRSVVVAVAVAYSYFA